MAKVGRKCTVCAHPERSGIDADRGPIAKVAKRWGVSSTSLHRHRQHDASRAPKKPTASRAAAPAAKPTAAKELDAYTVAVETLESLRGCLAAASTTGEDGEIGWNVDAVPKLANAITSALRLLARLSGQLEISQAQIVRSAPWRELMAILDGVWERHPLAAKDWADALARAEGEG